MRLKPRTFLTLSLVTTAFQVSAQPQPARLTAHRRHSRPRCAHRLRPS